MSLLLALAPRVITPIGVDVSAGANAAIALVMSASAVDAFAGASAAVALAMSTSAADLSIAGNAAPAVLVSTSATDHSIAGSTAPVALMMPTSAVNISIAGNTAPAIVITFVAANKPEGSGFSVWPIVAAQVSQDNQSSQETLVPTVSTTIISDNQFVSVALLGLLSVGVAPASTNGAETLLPFVQPAGPASPDVTKVGATLPQFDALAVASQEFAGVTFVVPQLSKTISPLDSVGSGSATVIATPYGVVPGTDLAAAIVPLTSGFVDYSNINGSPRVILFVISTISQSGVVSEEQNGASNIIVLIDSSIESNNNGPNGSSVPILSADALVDGSSGSGMLGQLVYGSIELPTAGQCADVMPTIAGSVYTDSLFSGQTIPTVNTYAQCESIAGSPFVGLVLTGAATSDVGSGALAAKYIFVEGSIKIDDSQTQAALSEDGTNYSCITNDAPVHTVLADDEVVE